MSRTPSSTKTELESLLGRRGITVIDSSNRALVQKWLTAAGIPAVVAKGLPLSNLNSVYNDITDGLLNNMLVYDPETSANPDGNSVQAALETLMNALNRPAVTPAVKIDQAQVETIARAAALEEVTKYVSNPVRITIKDTTHDIPPGEHRHKQYESVLKSIHCGNVALIGPAGSGKTTLAEQCAEAMNIPFLFTGAISSEYKLTGFVDAHGKLYRTAFREAYEHGGLFLFDEIDASQPGAVLAFNAALANGHADFPDKSVPKHKDFYCMAAANTFWTGADRVYVGRTQLDGATLDRFIFIELDYDEVLERKLAGNDNWVDVVQKLRNAAKEQKARVIVSPRASIMGARLLAQGMPEREVLNMVVFKGMDNDAKTKLKNAAGI